MPLFQKSVLNKYLKEQDKTAVQVAFDKYRAYFHNPQIQQNIRNSKEEQFQEGFLRELFVKVFGYTINPDPDYNLTTEFKNQTGAQKADGAILKDGKAIGVIELKSTKTKDLEKVRKQAFDYKANQPDCSYVITSNFQKLRFYINDAVDYEEFDLFILSKERFEVLYLCLNHENVLADLPLKIKNASLLEEEQITKKFYADYSQFKKELFEDIAKRNTELEGVTKLMLYKKTQKLLDRFLFIFFAEDRGLLPPNSISRMIKRWNVLNDEDAYKPLYEIYKQYFGYLNKGRKGKVPADDIHEYNGGLFLPDEVLANIEIGDEVLLKHTSALTNYDFESQVDVNILGHIFEHSLNEIESTTAELEGIDFDKQKSKRKKDGVFYTPKYITKYIVDNTVGKLCEEKKAELGIVDEEYTPSRQKATKKKLLNKLENYRSWLLELTICDPACGSGAFLNQALEFLINEHHTIDELNARLFGSTMVFRDVENQILENNLFGVDINEESIDIARLSLWLRTAQRGRKLTTLNKNIKCGNSLIDDPEVAGDKAFDWNKEFPQVFREKQKKTWHVTFALHNSRYAIKTDGGETDGAGTDRLTNQFYLPDREPGFIAYTHLELTIDEEIILAEELEKAAKKYNVNILECNICADHVHSIIVCEEEELATLVGKWKGRTAFTYNRRVNPSIDEQDASYTDGTKEKFWAKSFHPKLIKDKKQLENTINYIRNNRQKHELPPATNGLTRRLNKMTCTHTHAFRTEYKGGFDAVIGNPPYVRVQLLKHDEIDWYKEHMEVAHKRIDISIMFIELGKKILTKNGLLAYITSNQFLNSEYGRKCRQLLLNDYKIEKIIDFGDLPIFEGALTYVSIFNLRISRPGNFLVYKVNNIETAITGDYRNPFKVNHSSLDNDVWILEDEKLEKILKRLQKIPKLDSLASCNYGIVTGNDSVFILTNDIIQKKNIERDILLPLIRANNCGRYEDVGYELLVLYPYEFKEGKTNLISETKLRSKYPNAYNYLAQHKEKLLSRKDSRKTFDGREDWFTLTRFGRIQMFNKLKIVFPGETKHNKFGIDKNKAGYSGARVFSVTINQDSEGQIDIYGLLGILNSKLIEFYLHSLAPLKKGGYYSYSSSVVNKVPIMLGSQLNLISNLSSQTNEVTSKLVNLRKKFNHYLIMQITTIADSRKIKTWDDLEFVDFIKELNKGIKKAGGEKLSISKEFEWMEIFEEQKQKALEIKSEINRIDKEIDQMVYELYGLTEEEIRVVEGKSTK